MANTEHHVETDEDLQERQHFIRIVNAFRYYREHALKRVKLAEKYYNEISSHHRELISHFHGRLRRIVSSIEANYEIVKLIIANTDHMFQNKDHGPVNSGPFIQPASDFDMDKLKTTLKQFVRDWSDEGKVERDTCYLPVIKEITRRFPKSQCNPSDISVLVPGAGLGRLAFEIAKLGYRCQGNEFSLFMLFASNFILNRCRSTNVFTLYPYVHQYSNNKCFEDQVRAVRFPDVNPSDLSEGVDFSMAAGDFLEVYTDSECWDCVATVYFIDTAHNIIAYIENIYNILKPGGYWINIGPLLYHFSDMPNESSIELSYEEVKDVIKKYNFEFLEEKMGIPSTYTQNPRSMLQYKYDCVYFVVRKPLTTSTR